MEKELIENSKINNEEEDEFVFPSKHYMPKELTQQTEFLQKYPEYDGRGTKIAILDTGVDPSCPGLQKTSDGKPKLIECMDLTGAGDVNTSTIKRADENEILIGLTERELKIPKTWENPSGEWHLGTKPLHELYSYRIKERINKETTEKFKKKNKMAIAEVMKELREHEKKVGTKSKNISDKEDREEINAKLEYLKEAENHPIESPTVDCIVWFDGEKWKACLDTTLTGDLENAKVISSFCENQEYGILSDKCLVSYCFNIHDDGNLLEICVTQNSHGTHVAHIAAGHFPANPKNDGLAPGAQIISLCIGDSRKYYWLTLQALIRALNKCIELKVDVINYSYGAPSNCVRNGSFAKLIKNVVEKHGIIFVASAGNQGPGLSTMNFANGKLHHSVIYVGAYLTAEMKETMYGHFEADNSVVFPFSSRGPCLDGTLGISISAPGAAIAGVPKHNLTSSELMAGTSMSAPNASGNIACLISAMKAESIPISPFRIKLGLMNSAKMPEDSCHHPFSLGAGIIQICSAFELIKNSMSSFPCNLTDLKINVNDKRGIYLRELYDVNRIQEFGVFVKAKFNCDKELEKVVNFESSVLLKLSEGSENFVKSPKYCRFPSSSFYVHIDPTKLEVGKMHYAEIIGTDSSNPSLGPLFRIPITVIIPEKLVEDDEFRYKKRLTLEPAIPKRLFLQTPKGSKYVKIVIKSYEEQKTSKFMLQSINPIFDQIKSSTHWIYIPPKDSETMYLHVYENQTTEYCITQFWSNLGSSNIKVTFEFYGFSMTCNESELTMFSTNPTNKVYFTNNLRKIYIEPTIEFTQFCQPLDPKEAVISPLNERDIIDGYKSFTLLLTYNFKVTKEEEYTFHLDRIEHYSQFIDCFLIQLSTSSKKHLYTCSYQRMKKLLKGDYIIQVYIRHSDPEILEKLKSLQLLATQIFKLPITGSLYKDAGSALKGKGQRFWGKELQSGETSWAFLEAISIVYLPISFTAGSYFKGNFFLQSKNGDFSKYLSSFDVKYMVTVPKSIIKKDSKVVLEALTESEVTESVTDILQLSTTAMKDVIRDVEIIYITRETDATKASALFEKLSSEYPKHLPIYSAEIERLSKLKDYPKLKKMVEKLMEVSESNKVAEYFGVKSEFNEENLRKKEIMEKKKTAIINALFLQANFVLDEFLKDILKELGINFEKKLEEKKENVEKDDTEKIASEAKTEDESKAICWKEENNEKDSETGNSNKETSENAVTEDENKAENKNEDKSNESKESIEKVSLENGEKENDQNVTTKNETKNADEKISESIVTDEEGEIKSKTKITEDVTDENINVTKKEDNETEFKKSVEIKNQATPVITELEVVVKNVEIDDKENITPSSHSKPANSPGNESRNSVSSDDSFEKIIDSGVDSEDKADVTNPEKNESKTECKNAVTVIPENLFSSECENSEDITKTKIKNEVKVNPSSDGLIPNKLETTNDIKMKVEEKTPEKSCETSQLIKTETDFKEAKIETGKDLIIGNPPIESHQRPEIESPTPNEKSAAEPTKAEAEKSESIPESDITLDEVEKVYRNYMLCADPTTENARIIQAKYSVAHKRYCTALSQLTKIIADKTTNSDYLYVEKVIIELLKILGWNHLAEEAQKTLLIKHRKFYRPF